MNCSASSIRKVIGRAIAIVLVSIASLHVSAQKQWTLEECIVYALENNISVKQQKLASSLADETVRQTRYTVLPNLNAYASHRYANGRTQADFTFSFSDSWTRSNSLGLSSSVTLFNGMQQRNNYEQAKLDKQRADFEVATSENTIALSVAGFYLQVLFAQELLDVAENQVLLTQGQVDRITKLVDAGQEPRSSLLMMEAQLANDELGVVNAENRVNLAYLDLMQLLNMQATAGFQVADPSIDMEAYKTLGGTPGQAFNAAAMVLPQIKSAEINRQSAEKNLSLAKGTRSPTLSLSYSMGSGYSSAVRENFLDPESPVVSFGDQINDNFNQAIGFSLGVPIFNRFSSDIAMNRAKISILQADYQLEAARIQLRKEVEQAYTDAAAALKRYKATEKSVAAQQESFDYVQKRFEVGMVTSFDFNESKTTLQRAESDLAQAKYDYVFKYKILEFYQGKPLSL